MTIKMLRQRTGTASMENSHFLPFRSPRWVRVANKYTNRQYEKRKKENPGKEPDMSDILQAIRLRSRDNARVVIPWNDQVNGGFCGAKAKPWIKPDEEFDKINVEKQDQDPNSVLNYYRRLLFIRKCQVMMVCSWSPFLFLYFYQLWKVKD